MFGNPELCFEALTDLRRENKNKIHKLSDIVFLVLAAVISGIEDWVGMEVWATTKEAWLRKYIKLANGVPSHDTLRAVMSRINSEEFNVAFTKWVQTELPTLVGCHVAVDGKTLRGSRDEQGTVHIMSAFAATECVNENETTSREKLFVRPAEVIVKDQRKKVNDNTSKFSHAIFSSSGRLIYAASGNASGSGFPCTKRSGCAWYAA
jgi:hypothetical protein